MQETHARLILLVGGDNEGAFKMTKTLCLALAAVAFGCASGSSDKKSDTVAAQSSAGGEYQRAADAQKKAADEQAKAEAAQKDVEQAQKALGDAQAKARGQQLRAQQAQAEAQTQARQAGQSGTSLQHDAAQSQRQQKKTNEQAMEKKQAAWTDQKHASGQILESSGNQVRVRTASNRNLALDMSDATAVTIDGKPGSISQVQPGSNVRATYQMVDGRAKALSVDVRTNRSMSGSSGTGNADSSGKSSDTSTTAPTTSAPSTAPEQPPK